MSNVWGLPHAIRQNHDQDAMKIFTVSNLYPRPDQPTRGMYNAQLFGEIKSVISNQKSEVRSQTSGESEVPVVTAVPGGRVEDHPSVVSSQFASPQQLSNLTTNNDYLNICLVPEWRIWRWRKIRHWTVPVAQLSVNGYPLLGNTTNNQQPITRNNINGAAGTVYVPVFYLPLIGHSINWWFYYRALRGRVTSSLLPVTGNNNNQQPLTNNRENGAQCAVLASWLYPDAVAVARIARDLGVPVWLRVHGTDRFHLDSPYRRRLILAAVEYAKGVICNANSVAEYMVKRGVPAEKIHIIPNGVDTSLFRFRNKDELSVAGCPLSVNVRQTGGDLTSSPITNNQEQITEDGSASGGTILFIANLVPIKGPDVMLRAFAALGETSDPRHQTPNPGEALGGRTLCEPSYAHGSDKPRPPKESKVSSPHLLIIGSGPMRGQLERMARELGIADQVHFLGNRPHSEVAIWMNRADVLCLTSRSEGMPNVVVEALASGLPVVATAVGACPELLADEPAARLCPSEDIDALAVALKGVLGEMIDRPALASRHQTRYSWRQQAEVLVRLIFSPELGKR